MNIKNLNKNQINVIAGGTQDLRIPENIEDAMHSAIRTFIQEHKVFQEHQALLCINVANTAYGVTLCSPARKPLLCPNEFWEALRALPEEMPKC